MSSVTSLARPRRGHFDFGTGYHGDLWLDLDALFLRPALLRPYIGELAARLREHQVDAVCGPMEGGALVGCAIAAELEVAFLPAYRVRGAGQGAATTAYDLPRVPGGIAGWRVAVVDDAVNAGTAVRACCDLLRARGATVVAVAALLSLGPAGPAMAQESVPFYVSGTLPSHAWPAGRCPQCADGVAIDVPAADLQVRAALPLGFSRSSPRALGGALPWPRPRGATWLPRSSSSRFRCGRRSAGPALTFGDRLPLAARTAP